MLKTNSQSEKTIDEPKDFTKGCWLRIIRRPSEEIGILNKREDKTAQELYGHDTPHAPNYTDYSCCTFIKRGIPIDTFACDTSSYFGIFIKRLNRNIEWWYNGEREIVTDDIPCIPGKNYNNGGKPDAQLCHVSEDRIARSIEKMLEDAKNDYYCQKYPDEPLHFSWNEGKFRYQKKDIAGIFVYPEDKKSVENALNFVDRLNVGYIPFYFYNAEKGECNRVSSKELREKLRNNKLKDSTTALLERALAPLFTSLNPPNVKEIREGSHATSSKKQAEKFDRVAEKPASSSISTSSTSYQRRMPASLTSATGRQFFSSTYASSEKPKSNIPRYSSIGNSKK